jgi:hypothetical protein
MRPNPNRRSVRRSDPTRRALRRRCDHAARAGRRAEAIVRAAQSGRSGSRPGAFVRHGTPDAVEQPPGVDPARRRTVPFRSEGAGWLVSFQLARRRGAETMTPVSVTVAIPEREAGWRAAGCCFFASRCLLSSALERASACARVRRRSSCAGAAGYRSKRLSTPAMPAAGLDVRGEAGSARGRQPPYLARRGSRGQQRLSTRAPRGGIHCLANSPPAGREV